MSRSKVPILVGFFGFRFFEKTIRLVFDVTLSFFNFSFAFSFFFTSFVCLAAAYSSTVQLNLVWAGDDRNNSAFIRVAVNVPRGSTIQKADLILVSDATQFEYAAGRTGIWLGIEDVNTAEPIFGDALSRKFAPRLQTELKGDWYNFDDVRLDVTSLVQSFVNRGGFLAGNFANFIITGSIPNQRNTRTAKSGQGCNNVGGVVPCGPRLVIQFSSSGSGSPVPVDCEFTYSAWSSCTGGLCGQSGQRTRDLLVLTPSKNGGQACPTQVRQTEACPMPECVPQPIDCDWEWSEFSKCSGPCSSFGSQTRRVIINGLPENGGQECPTVQTETRYDCQTDPCPPIDCVVDFSSNWGPCMGACGQQGQQTRTGTIITNPEYGGKACPSLSQSQACQMAPCAQDCVVTFGDNWGACVGQCGTIGRQSNTGTVTQEKIGDGSDCEPLIRFRTCLPECPDTDCVFEWGPYSPCIGTGCGITGYRFRNPDITVAAQGNGVACPNQETQTCYMGDCAITSSVTTVSSEVNTYGLITGSYQNLAVVDNVFEIITESSFRISHVWKFENIPVSTVWEFQVTMGIQNLLEQSITFAASTDGSNFQEFLSLSSSSTATYRSNIPFSSNEVAPQMFIRVTNSDTTSFRPNPTRLIVDRVVINGYAGIPPKIDCVPSRWVTSPCSQNCGIGTQTLSRTILQPSANGGVPCGPLTQQQTCSDFTKCPKDCVFGPWVSTGCNRECGNGIEIFTRIIIQEAQNGGGSCASLGGTTRTESCNLGACIPGNCVWGPWSEFSTCSKECGGGVKTQTRTIETPASNGGAPCTGSTTRTMACNENLCPGADVTITVTSVTLSDAGNTYQSWNNRVISVPGAAGVTLHVNERATDISASALANGSWQIVNSANSNCVAKSVNLQCPSGTTNSFSSIADFVGRLTCTNSVGRGTSPITAVFTITCL